MVNEENLTGRLHGEIESLKCEIREHQEYLIDFYFHHVEEIKKLKSLTETEIELYGRSMFTHDYYMHKNCIDAYLDSIRSSINILEIDEEKFNVRNPNEKLKEEDK